MKRQRTGSLFCCLVVVFVSGCASHRLAELATSATRGTLPIGWTATFPVPYQPVGNPSAGVYSGGAVEVKLESISPALMEPSPTGVWAVSPVPASPSLNQLVFTDSVAALRVVTDPRSPNFYDRRPGAISALAWVDQSFNAVEVSVLTNTAGGPAGQGTWSRQGPMAHWDRGSNWLWCAVNYATGTTEIVRSRVMGVYETLPGSKAVLSSFSRTDSHRVTLDVIDNTVRCRVFTRGGQLLSDSGTVIDPNPTGPGVSGYLVEVERAAFERPLEGSFADLSSYAIER